MAARQSARRNRSGPLDGVVSNVVKKSMFGKRSRRAEEAEGAEVASEPASLGRRLRTRVKLAAHGNDAGRANAAWLVFLGSAVLLVFLLTLLAWQPRQPAGKQSPLLV